ncbi:hypothetical protein [Alkalihalobacillus pseudalcaliphilus]|uniref:hypothetical protein n=1 Tax=Alkalihalobacillus pseudalcaliphilus TaxID=79884 RepID=UPI00064DAD09|nr:hypothetical protein [Alkalihalobacillus pseudalcaliphilus]KMK74781.1 hypothetical protein AB990_20070 [Alkalihalobacillus pseudalcaliphilus]
MSRIDRSLKANRIHEMYVQLYDKDSSVQAVQGLSQIQRTRNDAKPQSENKLIAYDHYYRYSNTQHSLKLVPHVKEKYKQITQHLQHYDHIKGTQFYPRFLQLFQQEQQKEGKSVSQSFIHESSSLLQNLIQNDIEPYESYVSSISAHECKGLYFEATM